MEVRFPAEIQQKLDRAAAIQGRNAESLVCEAVERLVDADEWFIREVNKGLAAAEGGELVDHEVVSRTILDRFPA